MFPKKNYEMPTPVTDQTFDISKYIYAFINEI